VQGSLSFPGLDLSFSYFFLRGGERGKRWILLAFLQGVLEKVVVLVWLFAGEVVVNSVVKMVA
jgi:hypothetical protein